jgi:hypothetical protein
MSKELKGGKKRRNSFHHNVSEKRKAKNTETFLFSGRAVNYSRIIRFSPRS